MGVKNHVEDGTGHILSLGLDLDYLHVDGAERQLGAGDIRVTAGDQSNSSSSFSTNSSFSSSSSCSNFSDSDDERLQNPESQQNHPECSSVRLDLTPNRPPGDAPQQDSPSDSSTDCRSKVEFALKLGYSEDLVLLVLRKLGPDALINDVLGELVKLGTKTEIEQQRGSTVSSSSALACSSSSSSSSSSSLNSPLDPCRLLCPSLDDKENLRPVVVDGSNVAMSHGNKEVFSCQGIQLAVDWFLDRGHRDITVFVPAWRKEQSRPDAIITDQEILRRLEKEKILVFTPSRRVQGRRVVCYDDRFIVKLAYESDGIIVSNDNYRDLANEKPEWKKFIDERLLMYSFVNDKFMPPDDPLGRHGPSLENFLRKKPIIPEHRKQPCPYGKKCTYGHKCKFYHPERGSQPQRAVADELRASAKMSSAASRVLLEDALMVKSQRSGQPDRPAESEPRQSTPKTPSNRSSISDLLEDRLHIQSKVEACRGNASSSSSSCRSFQGYPAPGGSPSLGNRWEQHGGGLGFRVAGASAANQPETYHRCESPDLGYSSMAKAYSSLSLVVPPSPERFHAADLRGGSMLSDCSSEGSVSSDSFSPDPLLDEGPKCHHHHHHHPHHHHHHCSGQYDLPVIRAPPGLAQRPPHGCTVPPAVRSQLGLGVDYPPSSVVSPRGFKSPSAFIPPHVQHPFLSREFPTPPPPQTSSAHSHSQSSPLRHNLTGSLWEDAGLQDSQRYNGSPRHSQINQQPQMNWDLHYQQSPKPRYDPYAFQSLPEVHEKPWHSPWGRQTLTSPRGFSTSSFSSLPLPSAHKSHQLPMPQHEEPPSLGRYQDLRERVYVNLCRIFPPDLVRIVMSRNPHTLDAQELAAVILLEKSQLGS